MNKIKIDLERIISDIDNNIFGGYCELAWGIHDIDTIYSSDSPLSNAAVRMKKRD